MTAPEMLVEALMQGQFPQNTQPDNSFPDGSLVGRNGEEEVPLMALYGKRSRLARKARNDDDEVMASVVSILNGIELKRSQRTRLRTGAV